MHPCTLFPISRQKAVIFVLIYKSKVFPLKSQKNVLKGQIGCLNEENERVVQGIKQKKGLGAPLVANFVTRYAA
uniref:Uncharacterized protein n=1 Tax=uncultured prokaryote TaxID=198431 RepID=A0A0H5Q6K5_9ZZZZ|nr:hypothetical protein [uncultured prokaryote]